MAEPFDIGATKVYEISYMNLSPGYPIIHIFRILRQGQYPKLSEGQRAKVKLKTKK
jgi:hypothetical protein